MQEDDTSGRASLVADDGERRNFHRFAQAPPATLRHAGHTTTITTHQVTAQHHDLAVSLGYCGGCFGNLVKSGSGRYAVAIAHLAYQA